ncbi:MAG: hypothetical protein ACOZCL_02765 [Bacillota bacterium]
MSAFIYKQNSSKFSDISYKLKDNVVEMDPALKSVIEKYWNESSFTLVVDKNNYKQLSEKNKLMESNIYVNFEHNKGFKLTKLEKSNKDYIELTFEKAKPDEIFAYLEIPKQIVKLDSTNFKANEDTSITGEFSTDYHRIDLNNKVLVNNTYANVVANGYIEIISPAIIGYINSSSYEIGFIGHVYSDIKITSDFKASKTYRVKVAEYGIDCEVGEAVLGIYIIVRAGGSASVELDFQQETWIDVGVNGDCMGYLPTSAQPYDWSHSWSYINISNFTATVWTAVGLNPRAAVTIMDWDLVALDPEAGILARLDYINGDYRLRGWGYLDIDVAALDDDYNVYYKEWLIYDEWF